MAPAAEVDLAAVQVPVAEVVLVAAPVPAVALVPVAVQAPELGLVPAVVRGVGTGSSTGSGLNFGSIGLPFGAGSSFGAPDTGSKKKPRFQGELIR